MKKYEIIGEIHSDNRIEKEYTGNGFIYKNLNAFYNKTDEVCYINELDENEFYQKGVGYTYNDFYELVKNYFNERNINLGIEKYAEIVFSMCDWQSPETILNEFEDII